MKKSGLPLLYTVLLSAGTVSVVAQAEVIDGAPEPETGTAEQTRIDTAEYSVHGMLAADESDNDDDLLINEEYLAKVRAQEAAIAGGSNVSSAVDSSKRARDKVSAEEASASDLKSESGNKASASKGAATGKVDNKHNEQLTSGGLSEASTDAKVSESRPDVIANKLEANKDKSSVPVTSASDKAKSKTEQLHSSAENTSLEAAKSQASKNVDDDKKSVEKTSDARADEEQKLDKNADSNVETQAPRLVQEEQGTKNTTNAIAPDDAKAVVATEPDDKTKINASKEAMASVGDDTDSVASSDSPKAKTHDAARASANQEQNQKTGSDSSAKKSDDGVDKSGSSRQKYVQKDADSIEPKESHGKPKAQKSVETLENVARDSEPDNNGASGDKSSQNQHSQTELEENKNSNVSNTGANASKDADKSTNVKAGASNNAGSKEVESKLDSQSETKNKDTDSAKKSANNVGSKTEATNAEPGLYTRAYLENMYLPFFYHSYDLPQQLNHSLILRRVRLADEGVRLVYEIGIDSSMGPMDLDGEPVDNRILQLFCRIAMGDGGVLHRSQGLVLEFFHGNDAFFSKNLTYKSCTGKDVGLVRRSTTEQEQGRLDDEFVYAYQESMHKDGTLTRGYLEKYFVPYALERIPENFAKVEESRELTLGKGTELLLRFELKPEDKRKVAAASFVTDRIRRTCRIGTYAEWVLPYIDGIRYEYRLPDGMVVRSVSVDNATCAAMKDGSVH